MLSEIFYWLFNMSISASVVGILILLLGKIKRLPRRMIHILWVIPFIRMWIPIGLSSRFSLMTLISKFTTRTVPVYDGALNLTLTNHIMAADSYLPITYKVNLLDKVFRIASMVWIIVALALLIINTILYIMARYEVSDANHLSDNIYASDRVLSPVTYGIIRPRIIIPKEYKADDLQYILAHETAHIYRKDNLCRILALMSTLVHWFNPLIWLFLKKFLEVTELACDESVLAACGEDEKKAYATALVNSTESRSVFASAFGGARIKVRISYILSYKRLSILSIICFTLLAMTIAYVLLTNAAY